MFSIEENFYEIQKGDTLRGSTFSFKVSPTEPMNLEQLQFFPHSLQTIIDQWLHTDMDVIYYSIGRDKATRCYQVLVKLNKETGTNPEVQATARRTPINEKIQIQGREFLIESTHLGPGRQDYAKRLLKRVKEIFFIDCEGTNCFDPEKFVNLDQNWQNLQQNTPLKRNMREVEKSLRKENQENMEEFSQGMENKIQEKLDTAFESWQNKFQNFTSKIDSQIKDCSQNSNLIQQTTNESIQANTDSVNALSTQMFDMSQRQHQLTMNQDKNTNDIQNIKKTVSLINQTTENRLANIEFLLNSTIEIIFNGFGSFNQFITASEYEQNKEKNQTSQIFAYLNQQINEIKSTNHISVGTIGSAITIIDFKIQQLHDHICNLTESADKNFNNFRTNLDANLQNMSNTVNANMQNMSNTFNANMQNMSNTLNTNLNNSEQNSKTLNQNHFNDLYQKVHYLARFFVNAAQQFEDFEFDVQSEGVELKHRIHDLQMRCNDIEKMVEKFI